MRRSIFLMLALVTSVSVSMAQINGGPVNVPVDGVVDGVYVKEHIPTKRMIPYEHVREADYIWSQRLWTYVDLREKINLPLYYPLDDYDPGSGEWVINSSRWSLWTIIKKHVISGDLTLYYPQNPKILDFGDNKGVKDGDQLKYPLRPQPGMNYETDSIYKNEIGQLLNLLSNCRLESIKNSLGEDSVVWDPIAEVEVGAGTYMTCDTVQIISKYIAQYRLKTDWFFDKERSVLDKRIIAIAPVIYDAGKEGGRYKELFWLYFPQCRYVFNNYYTYNDKNDAQWMSFDDLFWSRRFTEVVYQESNVYDRKIDSYVNGVQSLLESERIKEEIRNIEHDMWHF
jgi:gliding motility associated protien GldN